MTAMYDAAVQWLTRGAALLPLQPGSKRIVAGFGPYLKHIVDTSAASFWFQERNCNMAVLTGNGLVALDFDDVESYELWRGQNPGAAQSLTERTRHGFHVFFSGESQTGRHPEGFEVKGLYGFVTVAPSSVGGVAYSIVNKEAGIHELPHRFPLLSENQAVNTPVLSRENHEGDVIGKIKAAYSVLGLAQAHTLLKSKNGRWWHGDCPLEEHKATLKDKKLAFWVDSERGLWGCYACGLRGDVVNLYANLNGLSVNDAIRAMAAKL